MLSSAQQEALENIEGKTNRINQYEFSLKLEKYVKEQRVEYIDGLKELCELYDIDYDNINKYLTSAIKQKIAKENGLLKSVYNINSALPV